MATTTVSELMTTPVFTAERGDRPGDVASAMLEAGVNSIVVIDDDCHPVGIVTATDYVGLTASGTDPYATTLSEEMTTDIVTGRPDEPVATVADRMAENDISHLPIVDGAGETVGIVTTTDLTSHLAAGD